MLTTLEDVIILVLSLAFAVAVLWTLQYFWPGARRLPHNELVGWHLTVLGTTYAVIIGFMLYAVWTEYQLAELNADNEANSLVNVYRLADGLPDAQRDQIHKLARDYAEAVTYQEWPAMHDGKESLQAHPVVMKLWAALTQPQIQPATPTQQASANLTLAELSTMTRFRRVRHLEDASQLPTILWVVMIFGGLLTVLFTSLFGCESFWLHLVQVLALTSLICLILLAIADIDRPFRGSVHVEPTGFLRAIQTFSDLPANAP
ncbi:MAG TPA: hypothetical protein VMU43_13655 [Candidatus Acidoferrum sp.]|nr:hypothetical protein [Candidatus Acidoferrum sp.]